MKIKLKWRIPTYAIFIGISFGTFLLLQPQLQPQHSPIVVVQKTPDELRAIAENGSAEDQFNLGDAFEGGRGVPRNFEEAAKWYRKAADRGLAKALNRLANLYDSGDGLPLDYQQALKLYQSAAELGDANAIANIGRMYANGFGVEKDLVKAVEWYERAAEKGQPQAQNFMGLAYKHGNGVPQDYEKAITYFRQASEQNFPHAQANLAEMYRNGLGVEKNQSEAGKLYKLAADNGLADAANYIKDMQNACSRRRTSDGDVLYDLNSCFFAAETGDPKAMHAVGLAYMAGRSVKKDMNLAIAWLTKGAKAGNTGAQVHLAIAYDEGDGVPKDEIEAYAWFSAAETQPDLNELQKRVIPLGKRSAMRSLGFVDAIKARMKASEYVKNFGKNVN